MFEARLFVDGRLTGLCTFAEDAPFPLVMDLGVDIDKYGNNEKLLFPQFHKELLKQSGFTKDNMGSIFLTLSSRQIIGMQPMTLAASSLSYPKAFKANIHLLPLRG